jgi:hypothetical protein
MPILRTTLSLFGAAVVGTVASAAELTAITSKDDAVIIAVTGELADGDADGLEARIKAANDRGQIVSAVRLDSPGGSLAEAIKLADLIRRAKLPTLVAAGSRCASACFIVFAAGIEKFASYDASIGVHGVSDESGHETARTEAATISMARIANAFGVPTRIIGQMVVTPARDISWLSPDDLRSMGTIMTGRASRPASPVSIDDRPIVAPDPQSPEAATAQADRRYAEANSAASRGDYASAIRLWQRFADAGDGVSQYNLGQTYEAGQGVAQDFATAAEWYRRAAESGIPHARLNLGIAYALGRGVPRDLLQAYKWLSLATAAYRTDEDRSRAVKARDLVATKMTSDEVAEAQRLAREWKQPRGH